MEITKQMAIVLRIVAGTQVSAMYVFAFIIIIAQWRIAQDAPFLPIGSKGTWLGMLSSS